MRFERFDLRGSEEVWEGFGRGTEGVCKGFGVRDWERYRKEWSSYKGEKGQIRQMTGKKKERNVVSRTRQRLLAS